MSDQGCDSDESRVAHGVFSLQFGAIEDLSLELHACQGRRATLAGEVLAEIESLRALVRVLGPEAAVPVTEIPSVLSDS